MMPVIKSVGSFKVESELLLPAKADFLVEEKSSVISGPHTKYIYSHGQGLFINGRSVHLTQLKVDGTLPSSATWWHPSLKGKLHTLGRKACEWQ